MEYTNLNRTYVALLDILGFKELASNNSHSDLIEIYRTFDRAIKNSLAGNNFTKNGPDLSKTKVNTMTISDSVILWTDNAEIDDFYMLLILVRDLLFHGFFCGLPFRGAIVIGPLSYNYSKLVSNSQNHLATIFGKSIIESYEISSNQDWAGVIISDDAVADYESKVNRVVRPLNDPFLYYEPQTLYKKISLKALIKRKLIRQWQVPQKNGDNRVFHTVDWTTTKRNKYTETEIKNCFSKYNKMLKDNDSVQKKIQNTIDYIKT